MARMKAAENSVDPATGRPLPAGVTYLGAMRYRTRKTVDGARINKTFKTARLAREWLEATSVSDRDGTFVDTRPLKKWTVLAMVEQFVLDCLHEGGPRRGWLQDLGHIPAIKTDEIAKLTLDKLTPFDVRNFRVRQIEAGFAEATVVKRMNLIQAMLKHAMSEWGLPLTINVATGKLVKRPKHADKKRTRRLRNPSPAAQRLAAARGEDELPTEEAVLHDVMRASENKFDLPMVRFATAQATRLGEQLGMRWRHVDFEARSLVIAGRLGDGTKNDDHKEELGFEVRALMPQAAEILLAIRPEDADLDAFVFLVGGYNACKVRVGRLIKRAAAAMTGTKKELRYLEDLRFHDLRHEATSRLAKVYKDDKMLMAVTGHMDMQSLIRYYQPDPTELAMVAEEYELARAVGIEVARTASPPRNAKARRS